MEHTKGEIEVWSHIGRGWAVQVMCCKDGKDALSGRDFEEAQANADEIVRRFNAFEDGGLVEELRTACEESQKAIMLLYECNKKVEIALGSGIQLKKAEELLEAALAKS